MLISVLEMIVPLIISFSLGILAAKTQMINEQGCNAIKTIISKIILTVVLFDAMLFADYSSKTALIIVLSVCAHILLFLVAFKTSALVPSRKKYFPFAASTWEGGSLGDPLCLMIFGQSGMSKMAILDIGCALPIFMLIIPYLQIIEGNKPSKKQIVKNIFSSPSFDAVLLGVILGTFGFAKILASCSMYPVYRSLVSNVGGSCTFLILFTVGYGFKLKVNMIKEIMSTVVIRLVSFLAVFGLVYAVVYNVMPFDKELLGVFIIAATLPTSFGMMTYGKFTDNADYMAGVLSITTIINLVACIVVKILLT